jgi:phosphorylase kinase alpha/beta subunit
MAKAALQAINDVGDLLGDGSKGSVIHVLPDEIQQCAAVLSNVSFNTKTLITIVQMLPRESFSKETDASLLSVISYPAFALDDHDLINSVRETITDTLLGKYGCRRFLRDG